MDWTLHWLFHPAPPQANLTLQPGVPLRLDGARKRQLRCLHGCVWITAPGLPDDIFLHAGECWTVPVNARVLVEAEGSAVVHLDC